MEESWDSPRIEERTQSRLDAIRPELEELGVSRSALKELEGDGRMRVAGDVGLDGSDEEFSLEGERESSVVDAGLEGRS